MMDRLDLTFDPRAAYDEENGMYPQDMTENRMYRFGDLLGKFDLEFSPSRLNGWRFTPKKWKNPDGSPYYGVMARKEF